MTSSVADIPAGGIDDPAQKIRERIKDAENYRRKFEPTWLSNLAFAAGQHWLVLDRVDRTLRHIQDVDPSYATRELYTADVITEQRAAALGELQSSDERPELLLPGNGDPDQDEELIQREVNRAVSYGWDYEWDGDDALLDVRRKCLDLGVAAIRCRFDRAAGPAVTDQEGQRVQLPIHHETGQPIANPDQARAYVADMAAQGQQAKFQPSNEGRICWDVGSAFNLLVPPGIPHEKDFPWEVWVRPAPLDQVKARYPKAAGLAADSDIVSVLGLGTRQSTGEQSSQQQTKLSDHVWLYTYSEKPTAEFPNGREVTLGGSEKRVLEEQGSLPYQEPNGDWSSGIAYFHWWRLTDRFFSKSFLEGLKDPQRIINRRKTQMVEIIDRGMPFVLVEEDTVPQKRRGIPLEFVELKKGTSVQPQVQGGVGPGEWFYRDIDALRDDLAHASTLSALQVGENPANVQTYSQLALLSEKEGLKRAPIRSEHAGAVARVTMWSTLDIQKFWPEEKKILVSGDDNRVQHQTFKKSQIPVYFIVRPARGGAKPRTQAAQLQLVTDIWNAALASTAITHDPERWLGWYRESLDAGQPLPLPEPPTEEQTDKARLENDLIEQGDDVPVAYYDRPDLHIPVHREAQDDAMLVNDIELWQRIENHVQLHLQVAQENAARLAAQQQPMPIAAAGPQQQPVAPDAGPAQP